MLPFQLTSQDDFQQHAKHPGIWEAVEDSIGVSSDSAKRSKEGKVFRLAQAFTQCYHETGLEMHTSKAAYP